MDNILKSLGLAYKGKRIIIGDEIIPLLKKHQVKLIMLASDASENTKKRYKDKSLFYKTEIIECFSKIEFGSALGKHYVAVIGILDSKMRDKILNTIESRWFYVI